MHDITQAAQLLNFDPQLLYGYAGYQVLKKWTGFEEKSITSRVVMRPGKPRNLPVTPDASLLALVEIAMVHMRSNIKQPFSLINEHFGFEKTTFRGMARSRFKVNSL